MNNWKTNWIRVNCQICAFGIIAFSLDSLVALLDGGVYSFVWPWPLISTLPTKLFDPISIPGIISLISALVLCLFSWFSTNLLNNYVEIALLLIATGSFVILQLTLIPAAVFCFITGILIVLLKMITWF